MALHSPYCADVPLGNCSLTHSLNNLPELAQHKLWTVSATIDVSTL